MRVDVGLVAAGRQEPGLDRPLAADALDPPAALREPDVAQPAAEEAPLSLVLRHDAERAQALVDDAGVDAFAVVGADELVPPGAERR
jgi:hypothetical protein